MKRSVLAVFLLLAGCSAGAPASPSPAAATPSAVATIAATAVPTPAATPTAGQTAGYTCDPDSAYGCHASPNPTATAATGEPLVVGASSDGARLVGPTGLTLYVFDNDSPGVSACNSGCVETWAPLVLASGQELQAQPDLAANFSTFTRADGSEQVAYNARPLYYYGGDSSPGDTNGDGLFGVWHVATPH